MGHEEHGISDEEPYMMPRGTCLTQLQKKKILEKVEAIGSDLHIYIAVMTRSSILVSLVSLEKYSSDFELTVIFF